MSLWRDIKDEWRDSTPKERFQLTTVVLVAPMVLLGVALVIAAVYLVHVVDGHDEAMDVVRDVLRSVW